jgi:hypothetical protein
MRGSCGWGPSRCGSPRRRAALIPASRVGDVNPSNAIHRVRRNLLLGCLPIEPIGYRSHIDTVKVNGDNMARNLWLVLAFGLGCSTLFCAGCGSNGDSDGVPLGGGGTGSGSLTKCSSDGQCSPPTPYCDTSAGFCIECLGDANCDGERVCNLKTHACVECSGDGDCGGDRPYCHPQEGECVECLASANCGNAEETCDTLTHRCVESCSTSGDCSADSERPYCDPTRSVCVECVGDGNCSGEDQPVCDATRGRCVECRSSAECGGEQPYCAVELRCVECLSDLDCERGTCDVREGVCRD